MDAFDRHAAFAGRGGATLDGAGAYVARSENTGPTRFPAFPRTDGLTAARSYNSGRSSNLRGTCVRERRSHIDLPDLRCSCASRP